MKILPHLRIIALTSLAALGLNAQTAETSTTTTTTTVPVTSVEVIETTPPHPIDLISTTPVTIDNVPEHAPLGVSLTTVIELDEPNPMALTVPMPPLSINPGTTVTLRPLSSKWTTLANVLWTKDGQVLANSATAPLGSLILPNVTSAASGRYRATFKGDGVETGTINAYSLVQPGLNHPLVNVSTRGTISPANPQLIVGFSIPEKIDSENMGKHLLIRAIGETLQDFGVNTPLPDPVVHVYDAAGNDVTPNYAFITIVYDDGSSPQSQYYDSVANAAAAAGAFPVPVPTGGSEPVTDYSELASLRPGAYTVVVNSASNLTGDVLVEVYQVGL